jgi:hypothetical protein
LIDALPQRDLGLAQLTPQAGARITRGTGRERA